MRALSEHVRAEGRKVVYVGTPGPDVLDLRAWSPWVDFAVASERRPDYLRELKGNARIHGWDGRYVSTTMEIGTLISQRTEEARSLFDQAPDWPTLVNYDVYSHPVRSNLENFSRQDGLWADIRSFLEAASDEVPEVLLLLTANVRGRSSICDRALVGIVEETRGYGVNITDAGATELMGMSMAKKTQVCIPYWLSRGGATAQGFRVEILDSLAYPGTGGKTMFHLALRIRSYPAEEVMAETPLLQLLNFGHRLLRDEGAGFVTTVEPAPVFRATLQ